MRKAYDLNEKVLKTFFEMLLDVPYQQNISEWLNALGTSVLLMTLDETIEGDQSENCLFYTTKETLSKYAISIGENGTKVSSNYIETMRVWMELVKTKIHSQDWKQRIAAFTFLSMVLEGSKNSLKHRIEEILRLIMIGVTDQHPRIKHAGLLWLGLFITDQTPRIQKEYHSEIVPSLINSIRFDPELKIKYISVWVMINFLSDLNEKDDDSENTDELKAENIGTQQTHSNLK